MPAWLVPGSRDTWVVLVHGRSGSRRDALRVLPALHEAGYPALAIAYRNDVEAPGGRSAPYGLGGTEWRDVESAVRYACGQGAGRVVVYGFSMGGAATMAFLHRSSLSEHVAGVVVEGPALDYETALREGLHDGGIPGPLADLSILATEWRYGVDFGDLNFAAHTEDLQTPILLLHGELDDPVPVAVADRFAAERPDLVMYERFPGAHHVRAWHADRARYESALGSFLDRVASGAGTSSPECPRDGLPSTRG
jgi:alpha-beta hydrolase superfamily lysophospholipase